MTRMQDLRELLDARPTGLTADEYAPIAGITIAHASELLRQLRILGEVVSIREPKRRAWHRLRAFSLKHADRVPPAQVVEPVRPGRTPGPRPQRDENGLTARDRDILIYVGKGLHNKEVGRLLGITGYTVHDRLRFIFETIDVSNRVEAAVWACQQGWLGDGGAETLEGRLSKSEAECAELRAELERLRAAMPEKAA